MQELQKNLYLLRSIREFVKAKNTKYYAYQVINEKEITDNTISIVMTSHERSQQVYFTLETINRCSFKDVQVIIVDDSSIDKINIERLSQFNMHIELISINREYKYWANPCVNYNIGFQYIRGGKVIIQNGEVCYIGDILSYIDRNVIKDNYYVFDVKATRDFSINNLIYNKHNLSTSIYNEDIWTINVLKGWYQHSIHRNANYHFLTAVSRETFDRIGEFSYDYSFGACYDDDDLVLKIRNNMINIINVRHEEEGIGGIHLYHGYTLNIINSDAYNKPQNDDLFNKKKRMVEQTHKYLELSEYMNFDVLQNTYNLLNTF